MSALFQRVQTQGRRWVLQVRVVLGLLVGVSCSWAASALTVDEWLAQTQEATRGRAYTGTLVVSAGEELSVSKVWHVCDRTTQMERVDSLSGPARTTIRRNGDVITFVPDKKVAYTDQRESLGLLPMRWRAKGQSMDRLYRLRDNGLQRVAGHDARVVELVPHDAARWGYRIWTELQTGIVIKMQTLDQSLARLVESGVADIEEAKSKAKDPAEFMRILNVGTAKVAPAAPPPTTGTPPPANGAPPAAPPVVRGQPNRPAFRRD